MAEKKNYTKKRSNTQPISIRIDKDLRIIALQYYNGTISSLVRELLNTYVSNKKRLNKK